MTSTLAHGAGRNPGKPIRPLRALAASPALLILLLGGLALRLTIAYVLFPSSGFESDIGSYVAWALTLGEHGPGGFYESTSFSDYPPAYLYLLWPIGAFANATAGDAAGTATSLIKLPTIVIDLVVTYVIYRLVLGWSWPGRRAETLALVAAALYLFNPVSFYDSALWGQTDAAGALVLLLGAAALIRGNSEGATALAATAAVVKPQFGVVLIPMVAAVLLKRHLLRPGSGPRNRPWAPPAMAAWLARVQTWPRLLTSLLVGLLTFYAIALPFGLGIVEYLRKMTETAGGYDYLTVNAFNLWSFFGPGGELTLPQGLRWLEDGAPFLGPFPAVAIGAALLAAGYLWGIVRAAIRDDRWTILVALTFLAIAFFILPTRVHERYIFPAVALMPILAVAQARWGLALVLLSAGAFINLHAVLTVDQYGSANVVSLPLGELFRTQPWIMASALLQTGVGLWAAWQLRPGATTTPDGFDRLAASGRGPPAPAVAAPPPASATATSAPGPATSARVSSATTDATGSWQRRPGLLDRLIRRVSAVPLRRDRSAELLSEPGGRVDRLDVLVVLVLIIGTATLRGYRVEEPFGMYFDEVYHARTATEFLQHWEYDQAHDIYEFTHPHLAKYVMAWGIRALGGNEVTATSDLGVPVRGAALERRWGPAGSSATRNGDRLYVGTGSELVLFDLATRERLERLPITATALALDEAAHRLYIADVDGAIFALDTTAFDPGSGPEERSGSLQALAAGPGVPVQHLVATDASVISLAADGSLMAFDSESGDVVGGGRVDGAVDAVGLPWTERVLAEVAAVPGVASTSERLAQELGLEAADIEARLKSGSPYVVVDAWLDDDERGAVQTAIDEGDLEGVSIAGAPMLAVAGASGISILDAQTLDLVDEISTSDQVSGLVLVERGLSEPTLYAATGEQLEIVPVRDDGPSLSQSLPMPGAVRLPAWNEPANLVHVLGDAADGGPTVYVIEPNGNSVFIDVPLAQEPAFLLPDTQPERPTVDRGQLLALADVGTVESIGIEQNAFGWRFPGVLLGALGGGLLYLLARILFRRRSVGLIAAVLLAAEGMLFANSRIAMNDVYVTTFVLAAVLLLAPLYVAVRRRPWTAMALLLGAGVALGLALAAKWVALYAVGGLVLLVLLRSALGRIIALVGMMVLTAVLGAMAIRPSPVEDPNLNWAFVVLMLALTGLLTAAIVRRPLPITRGEVGLAIVGPLVVGAGMLIVGFTGPDALAESLSSPARLRLGGVLAIIIGLLSYIAVWLLTRLRRGPFAREDSEVALETPIWLLPGRLLGLPWLFTLACLSLLPLGVYALSYAPWVDLGNQWLTGLPDGRDGQTLADLTRSMYEYHDNLRAEHAASSPWWAWPFDLKPVWFYQARFAGSTTGLIYDTGNLVIFWMGLPAMAFTAVMAWRRRSVSLALVVLMWAALLLPWARIDRATFQYHVYASLPFLVLALAYFLAELWNGPGRYVWFLARASAAVALLAVPLLWLFRGPLCLLAGTASAHPDGVACGGITRTAQFSEAIFVSLLVLAAGASLAAWLFWRASLTRSDHPGAARDRNGVPLGLVVVAIGTLAGVLLVNLFLRTVPSLSLDVTPEVLALVGLVVLAIPAWMSLRARDSRRFVVGVLAAAVLWLLIWYPNISGLPLPSEIAHVYQGLLPTWNWDFQFAVNLDPAAEGSAIDSSTLLLGLVTLTVVAAVAYVAWPGRQRSDGR